MKRPQEERECPGVLLACYLREPGLCHPSKLCSILVPKYLCGRLFQAGLTASAETRQPADALLLRCPPQFLRCIDTEFLIETNGSMRTDVLYCHQCTGTSWQRLHTKVVIEGHGARLNQFCDTQL